MYPPAISDNRPRELALIRSPDGSEELLLMFSCGARRPRPSRHAKRLEEWGAWMREGLGRVGTCLEFSGIPDVSPFFVPCPKCVSMMGVISFPIEHAVIDVIINHSKLNFFAERAPLRLRLFIRNSW